MSAKVRQLVRWTLLTLAALLLLTLVLTTWLARSAGGRDFLLARAVALLPAGSTLRWQQIDGSLSGPLDIRGLVYADENMHLAIGRLRVDHGFWPLFSGRLDIRTLKTEQLRLTLAPDDEPFELPRWPDVLPTLDLPVTVAIADLQLREMQVLRGADPLLRIARIDGGLTLGPGELTLRQLVAVTDRGRLQLGGDYLPRENFRTTLQGAMNLPVAAGAAPAALRFSGKGDLDDFAFVLDGAAPGPLSMNFRLRDGRAAQPRWTLASSAGPLLARPFGLADDEAYAWQLQAAGLGGAVTLDGRLQRGEMALTLAQSRLRLSEGVLTLQPLAVQLPQGRVEANGTLALDGKQPRFDLRLSSSALKLRATPTAGAAEPELDPATDVLAAGELRVRGLWQAWTLQGAAQLTRGARQAELTVQGQGNQRQLVLSRLEARTPNGRLEGSGRLHWQPALGAAIEARMADLDPGYFVPDFPGQVSGALSATASQDAAGAWRGEARLADIRGTLRRRALRGEAQVKFAGDAGSGDLSLSLGESRIEAGGRFGPTLDLQAKLAPLLLSDLWPDAGGRLQGTLAVSGPRGAPAYRADLRGEALRWGNFAADRLSALGTLPASGRAGDLALSATGLDVAGQRFDQARLALAGNVNDFQADLSLAGDSGNLTARASAARRGATWQGRLQQLQLAPPRSPVWRLQTAADYRYGSGALMLEPTCLLAEGGGRLCAGIQAQRATVKGSGLPLALLEPWLSDPNLPLQAFGQADFDGAFTRGASGAWAGSLALRSASGGLRVDPQSPRDLLVYRDLRIGVGLQQPQVTVQLNAGLARGGSVAGTLRTALAAAAPVTGELRLDVRELSWIELFSTDIAGPVGQLTGTVQLGGMLNAPSLSGQARLAGFGAELPALGVKLSGGDFSLRGAPDGQAHIDGRVRSGAGELLVGGQLNLRDANAPLQLTLRGQDITVADTPDLSATMSPDLSLTYREGSLQVRGSVLVPSARIELERLDESVSTSPDVVVLDPRTPVTRTPLQVDTDITLRLGEAVALHGFGLDGLLGGSLRVRERPGREGIANGTLEISGTYAAYGQALAIKRGRLIYVNAAYDNPALDILANREFEEVTVGVQVRGSALAPQTTVTSTPAMATSEAMAWLVLGRPLNTASGSETERVSASALALSAGTNLLAQRFGSRLGLSSAGINQSRALGGSALQLGKQISPRLFVSYGLSLIGTGQVITLKYLLRRGLNVSLESGTVETAASINWRKEK